MEKENQVTMEKKEKKGGKNKNKKRMKRESKGGKKKKEKKGMNTESTGAKKKVQIQAVAKSLGTGAMSSKNMENMNGLRR